MQMPLTTSNFNAEPTDKNKFTAHNKIIHSSDHCQFRDNEKGMYHDDEELKSHSNIISTERNEGGKGGARK